MKFKFLWNNVLSAHSHTLCFNIVYGHLCITAEELSSYDRDWHSWNISCLVHYGKWLLTFALRNWSGSAEIGLLDLGVWQIWTIPLCFENWVWSRSSGFSIHLFPHSYIQPFIHILPSGKILIFMFKIPQNKKWLLGLFFEKRSLLKE